MSINPIDENATPKPTGSLEELFRHHLGEEAAVPPRPMLWDQIDNSLLIKQNETYRRRLAATRWVAAASLLLATLAGTGWWAHRAADLAGPEVASATRAATSGTGTSANNTVASSRPTPGLAGASTQEASTARTAAAGYSNNPLVNNALNDYNFVVRGQVVQPAVIAKSGAVNRKNGLTAASKSLQTAGSQSGLNSIAIASSIPASATGTELAGTGDLATRQVAPPIAGQNLALTSAAGKATQVFAASGATGATTIKTTLGSARNNAAAGEPALAAFAQASATAVPEQVSLLATNPASLALTNPAGLLNTLTAQALPADASPLPAADTHKWHYGGSYAAGWFNPNVNFSRAGIEPAYDYNPALGAGSPALTEAAVAQYRQNLRPGLSQRIALLATRHLAGHWSLGTGAEFTQASARSATASAFVGEQILDLGQSGTGPLRTTNFRYRMAGIPVELSYQNPVKRGWSLYGRLGGVVSALLGVRSEVEGSPEATRTYSVTSAGTPYRRVLGSLRGAAGAQFRQSAGKWALTLGPVAELGLMPLNAHPAQSYLAQSTPYSFGLEAGVEFGR